MFKQPGGDRLARNASDDADPELDHGKVGVGPVAITQNAILKTPCKVPLGP